MNKEDINELVSTFRIINRWLLECKEILDEILKALEKLDNSALERKK